MHSWHTRRKQHLAHNLRTRAHTTKSLISLICCLLSYPAVRGHLGKYKCARAASNTYKKAAASSLLYANSPRETFLCRRLPPGGNAQERERASFKAICPVCSALPNKTVCNCLLQIKLIWKAAREENSAKLKSGALCVE